MSNEAVTNASKRNSCRLRHIQTAGGVWRPVICYPLPFAAHPSLHARVPACHFSYAPGKTKRRKLGFSGGPFLRSLQKWGFVRSSFQFLQTKLCLKGNRDAPIFRR